MGFGITFSPLVPNEVLWAAIAVATVAALLLIVIKSRGAWVRAIALALRGAGARQSVAHPRGPRGAALGRRRGGRQEPEPELRRPRDSRPRPRAPP